MTRDELRRTIIDLCQWIDEREFVGYDPYDALASPLLRAIGLRQRWLELGLTHAVKQAPVNLRPLLGVPPTKNIKGVSLLLSACVEMANVIDFPFDRTWPDRLLDQIEASANPTESGFAWGYAFDWVNREERLPKDTPNSVVSAFTGSGLLDWHEHSGDGRALELALAAGRSLMSDFNWTTAGGGACVAYTMTGHRFVYNANALVLALLFRLSRHQPDASWEQRVEAAKAFLFSRQAEDGSWPYGEAMRDHWTDHIHTGFLLDSLASVPLSQAQREKLERGYGFYRTHLFRLDGLPKFRDDRALPIDIHAVSQAILSLLAFGEFLDDPSLSLRAAGIAGWAMREMRNPDGTFGYQIRRTGRVRIPFLRWGQVWMLLALARLYRALE